MLLFLRDNTNLLIYLYRAVHDILVCLMILAQLQIYNKISQKGNNDRGGIKKVEQRRGHLRTVFDKCQ